MARLDGRVALVTGGANGIGRACAERFAEEGASVVVADLSPDAVVAGDTTYVRCDVTSRDDVEAAAERAVTDFGRIDILVTAAGISYAGYTSGAGVEAEIQRLSETGMIGAEPAAQLTALSVEDFQRVLDVNLTGTLLAVQAAAKRMLAAGRGGSIVTIASIAAKHPEAAPLPYTVSKAGVWMLTKHAARALAPSGIRVNAVGPGFIETNMTEILRVIPEVSDQVLADVPMGRFGRPREVADVVLFLASDESSYMTGELLHPDGGFYTD